MAHLYSTRCLAGSWARVSKMTSLISGTSAKIVKQLRAGGASFHICLQQGSWASLSEAQGSKGVKAEAARSLQAQAQLAQSLLLHSIGQNKSQASPD